MREPRSVLAGLHLQPEEKQQPMKETWIRMAPRSVARHNGVVIRLREWGTDSVHVPDPSLGPCQIGTSDECRLRLSGRPTASTRAELRHADNQWWIRNLGAPGELRQDGVPRERFMLTPGVEVGIGATALVAEDERMIQLRAFCQRFLGWADGQRRAVDHALRAIRLADAHRSSLFLCGEGDLVPIAHGLHGYMRDDDAPFIVCDQRRRDLPATVRSPANMSSSLAAFKAAGGGSLCIRNSRAPRDIDALMKRIHEPDSDVQLFVCVRNRHRRLTLTGTASIDVPPLQLRGVELPRIADEYAQEAIASLGVTNRCFTLEDKARVMQYCAQSLDDIEKATLRVVAIRATDNLSQAAARLGMAPVSLHRWMARRLPMVLHPELPG